MNHPKEEDLLLHAHRSLGLLATLSISAHLRGCPSCARRRRELAAVSSRVASAVRVGLPAWKPSAAGLRMQILAAALLVSAGALGTRAILISREPPPPPPGIPCEPAKAAPDPLNRVEQIREFAKKKAAQEEAERKHGGKMEPTAQ